MKKFIAVLAGVSLLLPALALADVSIDLSGGNVIVQQGQSYTEPGYSANSTVDGDITSDVSVSNPGTSAAGSFTITYAVTDSTWTSAFASRGLTVVAGGGTEPYCSSPTAPGWRSGLADGGCGGAKMHVVPAGSPGCPFFLSQGCLIKD